MKNRFIIMMWVLHQKQTCMMIHLSPPFFCHLPFEIKYEDLCEVCVIRDWHTICSLLSCLLQSRATKRGVRRKPNIMIKPTTPISFTFTVRPKVPVPLMDFNIQWKRKKNTYCIIPGFLLFFFFLTKKKSFLIMPMPSLFRSIYT